MSRHEGVSCDSCLKGNFRGRRYKCLICYDYDLCSTCYEAGATTTRHTTDHPVQCILTRSDFDMYYGGEALTAEQPQSFTCPYCCKMGFTDAALHEHVTAEHTDVSLEVVCPVCASLPGGDPNHVTDDFASHLALEHRTPRDFDEPPGLRHVRRIPHPGRGGGSRTRRANMHFGSSANTLTGLSPSGRESMDPIADVREWMPELLSQLSSVRNRAAAAQSVSSQLQQLEMQLQSTRQQLERMPRRPPESSKAPSTSTPNTTVCNPEAVLTSHAPNSNAESQYLLAKITDENSSGATSSGNESDQAERNMFVQELLLSTLTEQLQLATQADDPFLLLDSLRSLACEAEYMAVEKDRVAIGAQGGYGSCHQPTSGRKEEASNGSVNPNDALEVHCSSKNASANASAVTIGKSPPPLVSSSSGRPAESAAGCLQQQDGRNGSAGALASVSASASVACNLSSNVTALHPQPSSPRPSHVVAAAAAASPSPSPPQHQLPQQSPQGSGLNLSVGHDHPVPLTRQAAASVSSRDANRLNPAAAKRSMLKHMPASRGARDTEPPPH